MIVNVAHTNLVLSFHQFLACLPMTPSLACKSFLQLTESCFSGQLKMIDKKDNVERFSIQSWLRIQALEAQDC